MVAIIFAALATGCNKESTPTPSTPLLALSAQFVGSISHEPVDDPNSRDYPTSELSIHGQVYKDGAPVTKGAVDITVVSTTAQFNQSLFVPLNDQGNFTSPYDAFPSIHPGYPVTITAELTSDAGRESRTIELDSQSPAKKWVAILSILGGLLCMIAIFLYAFTGQTGRVKNRWAIQFSYVVILLFLAVPIVSPVLLLRVFPTAVDAMIGYPAGLVVTRIGEPPHANAQWAINIGGYSHVCVDLCLDSATLAQQADEKAKADAKTKADAAAAAAQTRAGILAAGGNGSASPTGGAPGSMDKSASQKTPRLPANAGSIGNAPRGGPPPGAPNTRPPAPGYAAAAPPTVLGAAAGTPEPVAANQPAVSTSTGAGTPADEGTSGQGSIGSRDISAQAQPNPTDDLIHPDRLDPPIVKVEGGLVIPLYVIVLSVIGGAINMTRKVPGFQKEGESGGVAKTHRAHADSLDSLSPDAADTGQGEGKADPDQAAVNQAADAQAAVRAADAPAAATLGADKTGADKAAEVKAANDKAGNDKAFPDTAAASANLSLEDQATKIDHDLDAMIPGQIERNVDTAITVPKLQALVTQMQNLFSNNNNPTLRGYRNFDEWYVSRPRLREILGGSWRVELLNQYMYLISAPFLAIVTYYILDLLGLSKPGVVVVLSFSVGLISEKIVTWILGIAAGYMQTPKT